MDVKSDVFQLLAKLTEVEGGITSPGTGPAILLQFICQPDETVEQSERNSTKTDGPVEVTDDGKVVPVYTPKTGSAVVDPS